MDMFSGNLCPKCYGTGWIIKVAEVYGREYEVASPCPECRTEMRRRERAGVPAQYKDVDLTSFNFGAYGMDLSKLRRTVTNFCENFYEWESKEMGLYISSETPGSGKTFLACCIARTVMIEQDIQMRFITATDYLTAVGNSYHRAGGEADESEVYRECRLLVLDDLGAQKEGSWQDQEIFNLINRRIINGRLTIITSNFSQKNLNLNDRTIDRIIAKTMALPMPEMSIRRQKAQEQQDKIIKSILG